MASGKANPMELLNDHKNDKRSNIVSVLSSLYKRFSSESREQEYHYEKYKIIFQNETLEVLGCIDEVEVKGPKYSDVRLGSKISNYGQFPYYWVESFVI